MSSVLIIGFRLEFVYAYISIICINFSLNFSFFVLPREEIFFSISCASTPERFAMYEEELDSIFTKLIERLVAFEQAHISECQNTTTRLTSNEGRGLTPQETEIMSLALELFYYWVNFGPLTRGTSATGNMINSDLSSST